MTLFVVTFLVLGIKWLLRDRTALGARGSLMLSLDQMDFGRLKGVSLRSMSTVDGRVNLQYQYGQQPTLDWTALVSELNQTTAPATVEIFVG